MSISDILGVAGVIVGIVGAVVGIVYGRSRGWPVFKQVGNSVVTAAPEEHITVQHAGKDVPRVTRTRIAFWNAGHRTLDGSMVVADYPVKFNFKGGTTEILSLAVIQESDPANGFAAVADPSNSAVAISFDYLEPRQGALLEVLHTSDRWGAVATGKIKGLPEGIREAESPEEDRSFWAFVLIQAAIFGSLAFWDNVHSSRYRVIYVSAITAVAVCLALFYVIRKRIYTEPKTLSLSRK